ncbi:hypothetical protein JW826_02525 [Candidatus Woesearchaeota archaeon]|nr:hypothetical protein [Candidatus Woesearchaeota archaeon]
MTFKKYLAVPAAVIALGAAACGGYVAGRLQERKEVLQTLEYKIHSKEEISQGSLLNQVRDAARITACSGYAAERLEDVKRTVAQR